MAYAKLGWHTSPVGVGVPKSFWQELDNAGIPAIAKGADTMSGVFDLQEITKTSDVPHVCVWRKSNDTGGGYQYDTPNYALPAKQAAETHWAEIKKVIPPELDKNITWIETINEVDKNLSDWLGNFSYELALLANGEGYKVLSFGWAGGEPEPEHWFAPGIQKYINYCLENKDRAGISVHEYTLDTSKTFEQSYPFLIGRFQDIHAACPNNNYPTIFISELGYTYDNIPNDWAKINDFLYKCGELYAQYPNVLGAAIWYLGTGSNWKDIGLKWQPFIPNVQNLIMTTTYPDPVIPPPEPEPEPPPETGKITVSVTNDRITTIDGFADLKVDGLYYRFFYPDGVVGDVNWNKITSPDGIAGIQIKDTTTATIELDIVDGGGLPTEPPIDPPPVDPPPPIDPPTPPVLTRGDLVVDVSHWNGIFDWEGYKAKGIQGAIIRASNGILKNSTSTDADGVDRQYWRNVSECVRLGIPFGVYHFLNGDYSASGQVSHFIGILTQTIEKYAPPTLIVALDAEPATYGGTLASEPFLREGGDVLIAELNKLNLVNLAGWYSRASWWNTVVPATATWPKQFLSWVAQWPSANPISVPPSINTYVALMNGFTKNDFWQFTSQGEDIFGVNDKTSLDVNYYMGESIVNPPQPEPDKVDLLPYFKGTLSGYGQLYEVETKINGSGAGQQRHQTQIEGNKFYFVKGGDGANAPSQWEELSFDNEFIRRFRDSSMSELQFYTLLDSDGQWSKWCPRYMEIGEVYQRSPTVRVYNKSDCANVSTVENVVSWIKLQAIHQTLECYNGIIINNVAELHWYNNLSAPPVEVYYFSSDPRIQGFAGWKYESKIALVSEIHQPGARPNSVRETICL